MDKQPVIIKRVEDDDHGDHHGGGWKVAYADFMTAMMAFFLLLWIVSAADSDKLKGLAEHFTPVMSQSKGGGPEVLDGRTMFTSETRGGGSEEKNEVEDVRPSFGQDDPLLVFDSRLRDARAGETPEEAIASPAEQEAVTASGEEAEQSLSERDRAFAAIEADVTRQLLDNGLPDQLLDNLQFVTTPVGLEVNIVDQTGEAMFESGSARINRDTRLIIQSVATALANLPNDVMILGHTDALRFASEGYDNWDLSSERANATRRVLVAAGLDPDRIKGVSGLAHTDPLVPAQPEAPENRRISISVRYPEE